MSDTGKDSNAEYWKNRAAWEMYHQMEKAEDTAGEIAKLYQKASGWLTHQAKEVFEKYMRKHRLSEAEARRLLGIIHDKTSIDDMLAALKNGDFEDKAELIAELEAPAYQARLERLRQLQNQTDIVMREIYKQEKLASTEFFTDLANETYYRSMFDIQKHAGLAFSFSHVSSKQIDRVLSMNWSGMHYSDRIWKNTQGLAKALKQELLVSLVTGRTERETAELIANKFGQGAMQSRRLVRTESNYVSGQMNLEAYRAADVEEYIFIATLDLRTSEVCREMDGKIFKVSEAQAGVNHNPMHPWCRSTTGGVVDRKYLNKMTAKARDPSTGKIITIPAAMTYQQWYDKFVKGKPEAELEEKKIKNRSFDRRQHEQYREILGNHIPKKLDDFQNMKYTESEKWEFAKLDYQRQNELQNHPELKLPEAEKAILPEGKFTKYLLGGINEKGLAKGKAFTSRLGYDINNWKELQSEIKQGAIKYPALSKGITEFGERYEQKMVLYGKNNTPANVVVGWMHKPDGTISMTSAYIKEVK